MGKHQKGYVMFHWLKIISWYTCFGHYWPVTYLLSPMRRDNVLLEKWLRDMLKCRSLLANGSTHFTGHKWRWSRSSSLAGHQISGCTLWVQLSFVNIKIARFKTAYTSISSPEPARSRSAGTERATLWTKSKTGTIKSWFRFDCTHAFKFKSGFRKCLERVPL